MATTYLRLFDPTQQFQLKNGAINTAAINANTTAQVQKVLDAIMGNRMADMQSQINALQLQAATANVLRFPSSWTFAGGVFPPVQAAA